MAEKAQRLLPLVLDDSNAPLPTLDSTRLLARAWSLSGTTLTESNQQLELDFRIGAGVAGGRDFVQNANLRLNGALGAFFNSEKLYTKLVVTFLDSVFHDNLPDLGNMDTVYRWNHKTS